VLEPADANERRGEESRRQQRGIPRRHEDRANRQCGDNRGDAVQKEDRILMAQAFLEQPVMKMIAVRFENATAALTRSLDNAPRNREAGVENRNAGNQYRDENRNPSRQCRSASQLETREAKS